MCMCSNFTILYFLCFVNRNLRTLRVLEGVIKIYELFRGKVAEQKKLRKLTDKKLAEMSGCSFAAVRAFMCGARQSDNTAKALAKALGIDL